VNPPQNKPSWKANLFVFFFALFVALLVTEVSLRIFAPHPLDKSLIEQYEYSKRFSENMQQHGTTMKVFDPLFHHSTYPNRTSEGELEGHPYRITTNNIGSRDHEDYFEAKPKNTFRVALTGDSFTVGLYVDDTETYAYYLMEKLKEASSGNKSWQLYNFANVSYSPLLYWQQYARTISKYHPDLLILAIDNSDLQDDYYYEQDANFDEQGNLLGFKDVHYSFFLGQVRNIGTPEERVQTLEKKMNSRWERFLNWGTSHLQMAVHIRDFLSRNNFKRGDIADDRLGHTREGVDWTAHWQRSAKYLQKTVQLAKKDGAQVLILFYPYPHQVNGTDWENRKQMGYEMGKVYDTPMRKWLADFAKKEGVDYLDTFDAFRQSGIHDFSFQGDPHYLPNGHQLLSRVLFEYLNTHYNQKTSKK
jgi:hypothetical protein